MARGSIRARGQAWELRAYGGTDPETGRERRISQTVHGTRKDAERALTALLGELDDGGGLSPAGATFAGLLVEWQALKARNWSTHTALETAGMVERWIAPPKDSDRWHWTPGRTLVRDVTTQQLDTWQTRMLDELAPPTVRRIHGVAHAALQQAVKWGWISRNPASNCEPVVGRSPEVVPPSPEDLRRTLVYLAEHEPMLFLLVRLGAITGRRRGELCALRWTDLDAEASTLTVSRTLTRAKGGWVEAPITKNRKRFPALAIDLDTRDMLVAHHAHQLEWVEQLGERSNEDDHVFLTLGRNRQSLGPWVPAGATRKFARVRAELEVDGNVTLKNLRHHVATSLIDEGVSMTTIAGRLGHGSGGRLTQEVYGHVVPATDHAAAEILARLLDVTRSEDD